MSQHMALRRWVLLLGAGAVMLAPATSGGHGPAPPPRVLPYGAAPALASYPSGARGRLLRAAALQLGYRDSGRYCSKFGPCESWCALFSTWAWERGGIAIPRYAFTGSVYYWALLHTRVSRPPASPKPGDAVLFGSGPRTVHTSLHVGIVEQVYPGYLVTLEGNTYHRVVRLVVPTARAWRVGEPGPIYAYASPLRAASGGSATEPKVRAAASRALLALRGHGAGPERPPRASKLTATDRRLARSLVALRAFQHMPYRAGDLQIAWTRVNPSGQVEVAVISPGSLAAAQQAWSAFLARWSDPGTAYAVTFYTAG